MTFPTHPVGLPPLLHQQMPQLKVTDSLPQWTLAQVLDQWHHLRPVVALLAKVLPAMGQWLFNPGLLIARSLSLA